MNPVLQKMYNLPPELRIIVEGDEVTKIIDSIGEKYEIPYAWRGELIKATVRVLSGLMKPDAFIPFIMEEYLVDQEEALHIALDINKQIFSAVKPQLASLYNVADEKIARRLKVPHKPRQSQIAEETELLSEPTMPIAPSADPAPAEQIATTVQYTAPVPQEGSIPSPMTAHFATIPLETPPAPVPHPIVTAPMNSPLASKLGNMRGDAYREPI